MNTEFVMLEIVSPKHTKGTTLNTERHTNVVCNCWVLYNSYHPCQYYD